jgi:DNA-directed RNA polymerase specialized sigma24 family protein
VTLPPFQRLLEEHGRDVQRLLVATVGPAAADDCYQETWLAALRAYPRLRDASNLRGWVLTIAHRKAMDHFRATRRAAVAVSDMDGGAFDAAAPEPPGHDGELWARVRGLAPKQRLALALRFVADSPYSEISATMGTSEEAARRNVHEGLKRLRMEYRR